MYSPRKQNTFLFYNHITTYREQLVVALGVREWGIYVRKSFSFLTPLLLAKEVFFFKMNLQPLTGPRSKQDRHKSTVPWQRHHHLGYPSLSSAFGHLLQVRKFPRCSSRFKETCTQWLQNFIPSWKEKSPNKKHTSFCSPHLVQTPAVGFWVTRWMQFNRTEPTLKGRLLGSYWGKGIIHLLPASHWEAVRRC